ncbi:MAG: CRISPR-associated endonuclease Cas1 [Bryobacteraceae bacterium]
MLPSEPHSASRGRFDATADLFLHGPRSRVTQHGYRLAVRKQGRVLGEAPPCELATVVLSGQVHLTSPAPYLVLGHAVPLALLSRPPGRLRGRLAPGAIKSGWRSRRLPAAGESAGGGQTRAVRPPA